MPNSVEPRSVDSFIAFFDVLGWKSLVCTTEKENDSSVQEAVAVLDLIRSELERCRDFYAKEGPEICPAAPFVENGMDFRFTLSSDSVVLSSEVSPAGLVSLLYCCWVVYFKLFLRKGLMCRGYIKRGLIYHTNDYCVGSGLGDVVEGEKKVSIFKTEDGEHGTPFIEIDENILEYVNNETPDADVKKAFSDFTRTEKSDDDVVVAAIFPFKRLDPGRFIPWVEKPDSDNAHEIIATVRNWIDKAKEMVSRHVDPSNESALQKECCIIRMLDAQLDICDRTERASHEMAEPYPAHTLPDPSYPRIKKRRDR